ncbi:MAG: hypothetical protein M1822_000011 [Bathelium mastoideum]|nr:MAG: hypothetical protein M1822_000011 [Bathelium mastoideum]
MTEVIAPPRQPDGHPYFVSTPPLRRPSPSQASLLTSSPKSYSTTSSTKPRQLPSECLDRLSITSPAYLSSPPQSSPTDISQTSSLPSTPASSTSSSIAASEEDDLSFPTYNDDASFASSDEELPCPPNTASPSNPPCPHTVDNAAPQSSIPPSTAIDDTAVRIEPSRHVDYLSHDWREEDIWSSWRHIVSKRKIYGERSRLENASWRTWAKSKYGLRTVSPETLNWLKESDVTWLYGPLQQACDRYQSHQHSEPASRLSKNNSFVNKKPILKKRSMSEVMLQRSLSASSLIKQAAASVQAQQHAQQSECEYGRDRPLLSRSASDFVTSAVSSVPPSRDTIEEFSSRSSSGLKTPDQSRDRHIRFDDTVEQCIAVDAKDGEFDEEERWPDKDEEEESDDGVVMMKSSNKRRPPLPQRSSRSSSLTGARPSIEKLPATKLKSRSESPILANFPLGSNSKFWGRKGRLSPSPSQETLRPSHPSTNFLLPQDDEDEDGVDVAWQPSEAFANFHKDNCSSSHAKAPLLLEEEHTEENPTGLRRTSSGMFMPYEEDEDDIVATSLFGRVVDTVNTARDIAHVIWNVGWRR